MPRANQDRYNPLGRVPRTIFAHGHEDGETEWLPIIGVGDTTIAYLLIPDNWNGLDKLYLWLLGSGASQQTYNITVDIATCDEAYNVHTQTVNGKAVNTVAGEYECVDLTTDFAAVLANLATRDIIRVTVVYALGDDFAKLVGIELQET